jgi:fructosamine-3-kinase
MAEFGRMVAELHEINFESFGELSADGGLLDEQCLLEALAQRARVIIKDATYLEFFLQVLEANSSRFTDVHLASLCHEDLHPFNILYKPADHGWQIATILDFDKAWAGHAESDLARLDLWRGIAGPAFWEAYSGVRGVDEKYDIRRPVYQLLWCLEFADPSDQHAADTARVCRQLGIRLPKPFR